MPYHCCVLLLLCPGGVSAAPPSVAQPIRQQLLFHAAGRRVLGDCLEEGAALVVWNADIDNEPVSVVRLVDYREVGHPKGGRRRRKKEAQRMSQRFSSEGGSNHHLTATTDKRTPIRMPSSQQGAIFLC